MTDSATPQLDDRAPNSDESELGTPRSTQSAVRYSDRLLVDALLTLDSIDPVLTRDPRVERRVSESPIRFEAKLVSMAASFPRADELRQAMRDVRSAVNLIVAGAIMLAFISGAGAARAALGAPRGEAVNFYFVLAGLLGVQSLLLILWIIMAAAQSRRGSMLRNLSLGGLILRLARWAGTRLHRSKFHAAAASAVTTALTSGALGRWTLGSITHVLWTAFNVGCLLMVIALLSAKQYVFVWETTILSPQAYVPMTRALATVPELVGFPVPNEAQIEASRWSSQTDQAPDASRAWSGLLVGSLVCYGFGPRILLLGLCLGQRRLAKSRHRLDEGRAEGDPNRDASRLGTLVRWHQRLMPEADVQHLKQSVDLDDCAPVAASARTDARRVDGPAIVAVELQPPRGLSSWPPAVHDVRWTDLGFVETRDDQRRVLRQLQSASTRPSAIIGVCSLLTAPDRGIQTFLLELRATCGAPLKLVLSGGQSLRQRVRADGVIQRVADWRTLAHRVGIVDDDVTELDLDHYTHASAAHLASLVGRPAEDTSESRLVDAFERIRNFAERPSADLGSLERDEAALHSDITRLYRAAQSQWRQLLQMPRSFDLNSASALGDQLRTSAQRMIEQLPTRLRGSHRWLAAGAAAGAIGCLAAATLISPVALTALPAWSALGAAVSAAIKLYKSESSEIGNAEDDLAARFDRAVRSATLLALVLELQGRGESAITRILDQALVDDETESLLQPQQVPAWLGRIRDRFNAAIAREARA